MSPVCLDTNSVSGGDRLSCGYFARIEIFRQLTSHDWALSRQGAKIAISDANSFKIHRTTNAAGQDWITLPVVREGQEEWISFIYAPGDEEITVLPSMIGVGVNKGGAIAHFAFVATLMMVQRMRG